MNEYHTPILVEITPDQNLSSLLTGRVASRPDEVLASGRQPDGTWRHLTAREFQAEVDQIAKGLIARGIPVGGRIGIMAHTSLDWALLDWASWAAGVVPVPIYETSSADQVEWIVSDAEVQFLVVEDDHLVSVVDEARAMGTAPAPDDVLTFSGGAIGILKALGRDVPDSEVEKRRTQATTEDLATIIYTSGTTGRPKGVELTHGNFVALALNAQREFPGIVSAPGASTLLFLPLAHVFARFIHVLGVPSGTRIGYAPNIKTLLDDLGSFRPTFLLAVPRVFEKVYNSADMKAGQEGKQKPFRWAAKVSITYSRALDTPRGPSLILRAQHKVADALVLKKIRNLLGGLATTAVSGGAALGERLGHFYRGLGLQVLEGYGLTETTAPISVNLPRNIKIGTVGRPFPGCGVKVDEDGELLVSGPSVFHRYHHNDEATKQALVDGWFRTGDLGSIDDDGYISITGRKKELIVTAGGKNVAPAILEDRFRGHPLVSQCVVVGDGQPFIAVLVTLDAEALPGWLKAHGKPVMSVEEAAKDPDVLASLQAGMERANRVVSRAESMRKFVILPGDFTIENGYLTPSLKVKRNLVLRDFADTINAIYAGNHVPAPEH